MTITPGLIISFCSFLVLFLFIGAVAAKRSKGTEDDYLLGSRSFGKWMVGLSAGATGNTSFILIAAVGLGYTQGVGALLLGVSFFLGEWVFWTFLAKPISKATEDTGAETVAELVTTNLPAQKARPVRSIIAVLIFIFVGAYLVAQFAGSAKILNIFFGLDTATGVFLAAAAILAYCTTGGLRASMWTDVVQALLMIGLTIGVMIHALTAVGGTTALSEALRLIDPTLLELTREHTLWSVVAFIVGFAAMGCGFGLSAPHVTVRVMAGKSTEEVKAARWIYLAFIYSTWGCMTVFGICCRLLLPEIADPEQALPAYAVMSFEPWLIGLVLAGVFSTIASSADSQILACSSALAHDVSPSFSEQMSARFGVRYQYAATLFTGIIAAVVTVYSSSTVFQLVIFSISVLSASLGAAMLITILKRPTSPLALGGAMLVGVAVALSWRFFGYHDFLSDVVPGILSALLTHEVVVSLFGAEKPGQMVSAEKASPSKTSEMLTVNQ